MCIVCVRERERERERESLFIILLWLLSCSDFVLIPDHGNDDANDPDEQLDSDDVKWRLAFSFIPISSANTRLPPSSSVPHWPNG